MIRDERISSEDFEWTVKTKLNRYWRARCRSPSSERGADRVMVPGETVVKEVMVPGETVVVEKEVVKTVEVPVEKLVVERVEVVKDIGWTPRAPEPNPKYGGIIRLSAPHRMAHFDFHQGAAAYAGQTNIYNNLVYYNRRMA